MARHFTRYGRQWEYGVSELDIELWCFKYAWPEEKGGLGRYGHAKNAINLLWNYKGSPTPIIWTPWIERMIETACKCDVVIMGGGSSSGKSLSMAIMATLFYLADPVDTLCLVTSTTIEGAKKRIFKDIKRLWRKEFPGKLVDGKGQIKGVNEDGDIDDSRGISIIPVRTSATPVADLSVLRQRTCTYFMTSFPNCRLNSSKYGVPTSSPTERTRLLP